MSEPADIIQPFPNASSLPEQFSPLSPPPPDPTQTLDLPPLLSTSPSLEPSFPKVQYFRFSASDNGKTKVPDINPDRYAFDRIAGDIFFDDGGSKKFELPFESCEFTYSKYGIGQPAVITLNYERMKVILEQNNRPNDYFKWVKGVQTNDGGKQDIYVEIRISSWTAADDGSSESSEGDKRVMWRGFIDTSETQLNEGILIIKCVDGSFILNEERMYGYVNDLTTDEFISTTLNWSRARLRITALDRDGVEFDTVKQWRIPLVHRKMGIMDVTGQSRFTLGEGQRFWDLIQNAAEIDGVSAFVDRGTLWYIGEDDISDHCGKFVLGYGSNIESFKIEHSSQQSGDVALIYAVADTIGLFGASTSGTIYVVVWDLTGRPFIGAQLTPAILSRIGRMKKYRVARYNTRDTGVPEDLDRIVEEARTYFREVTASEFIITVRFAGHVGADLFNRYLVQGTGTLIDGYEFDAKHISHHISTSGWSTELVGTNTVPLNNALPPGARFPDEGTDQLGSVDAEVVDGKVVIKDSPYYVPPGLGPGDPGQTNEDLIKESEEAGKGFEDETQDPPPVSPGSHEGQ